MNIFIFDYCMRKNVESYCDKHILKMGIEYTQIICTVLYKHNLWQNWMYKPTHQNHPAVLWAEKSIQNFNYLVKLAVFVFEEYIHRYNKEHKTHDLLWKIILSDQYDQIQTALPDVGITDFVQCMPEQYKQSDTVQAYKDYFNNKKKHIFNWKNRPIPNWITL